LHTSNYLHWLRTRSVFNSRHSERVPFTALLCYDHVVILPKEFPRLWLRSLSKSTLLFFAMRYIPLFLSIAAIVLGYAPFPPSLVPVCFITPPSFSRWLSLEVRAPHVLDFAFLTGLHWHRLLLICLVYTCEDTLHSSMVHKTRHHGT
jgi:hypothetical protein